MFADPAELLDRRLGIVEGLSVPAVLVLDRLHSLALHRLGDDHGRPPRCRDRLRVGRVDRLHVVPVDLDRVPAEGLGPLRVGVEVPAVHRLATLAEPVDVDDRRQVVELLVGAVLEGLPHRALRHLAVAAQHPDAVREPVEPLPGERDADGEGKALPERPGRDIDPREDRNRMPFELAAELSKGEELLVRDRSCRLVERVEQRRRMALREDQMVVSRVVGVVEVVVVVLRKQHRHQVRRRHRRGRVARIRCRGRPHRVDAQLLA